MLLDFTSKLINYNNINSCDIIDLFIYVTLHFESKIDNTPVLKYYSDVMMRCPGGDYSADICW